MQTVTNIPQDYTLTRYFAKFYSLYSVKSLPTAVTCNSRLRSVLNIVNRKAGVPLLQGASDSFVLPVPKPADGCGGCYKCADEYLYRLKFGFVRNSPAYVQKCMSAKAQFDIKYKGKDFKPAADRRFNRWGGRDTAEVQVLVDRVGYYIGTLEYDKKTCKWYTRDHFGSHHYPTREAAEAVCERFKQLYRI